MRADYSGALVVCPFGEETSETLGKRKVETMGAMENGCTNH